MSRTSDPSGRDSCRYSRCAAGGDHAGLAAAADLDARVDRAISRKVLRALQRRLLDGAVDHHLAAAAPDGAVDHQGGLRPCLVGSIDAHVGALRRASSRG